MLGTFMVAVGVLVTVIGFAQSALLRFAHPVDERADETGVQAGVDEASPRAQVAGTTVRSA